MIDSQTYRNRQMRISEYLNAEGTDAGVIVDFEGLRSRSLRYLCGQPSDALLFLFADGKSLLVPWDVPLSRSLATADETIAYETFSRREAVCIQAIVRDRGIRRIELPGYFPYPLIRTLKRALAGVSVECRSDGIEQAVNVLRIKKDKQEIEALREACRISDRLIEQVPAMFAAKNEVSELELAMFLESEARRRGAEGMGFDTLAASSRRSFAIHCFPNFTTETIGTEGFSLLDFGVRFSGYTSDVTCTLVRPPITAAGRAMIEAVEEAYELAQTLCGPGADPVLVGERIQEHFENRGMHMPHSLGHGIGLDAHEAPLFRRQSPGSEDRGGQPLEAGMVFTIEPGLYDPAQGGVRLENDFLCTENGVEVLTSARIIYLSRGA